MPEKSGVDLMLEDGEWACCNAGLNRLEGSRVLITGASGLVGLNMLATLAAARSSGVSCEAHASIHRPPTELFLKVARAASASVSQSDLSTPEGIRELPPADVVIHAAGSADPGVFMGRKAATLSIGACATLALVDQLPADGRLLFLSSSEVYQGLRGVADESRCGTSTPQHPRGAYIEAKRFGEAVCSAAREDGRSATVARLAITYGPGARSGDTRVVNALVERGLREGRVRLLDAGMAMRTLIYTRDAAELLWRIALGGTEAVYNVAGQSVVQVRELARIVAAETRCPVEEGYGSGAPGAAPEVRVDLGRTLGSFPKRDFMALEQGIARTVDWYRRQEAEGG